jgi:PAS domain S-box-containing protein
VPRVEVNMIYVDLILNLTLLVALSVVSGFIDTRWRRSTRSGVLLQGVLFGSAAVIGMLRPLNMAPGVIFDGRSVMVSLGALFFGPWATAVSSAMTIAFRIGLGGAGTLMGVLVILSSAAIGLLARRRLDPDTCPPSTARLYAFGLAVHVVMVALMFTLPEGTRLTAVTRVGLPVMLLFPLATILAGKLLSDQVQATRSAESLRPFKTIFDTANFGAVIADLNGVLTYVNDCFANAHGYQAAALLGQPLSLLHNEGQRAQVDLFLHQLATDGRFGAQEVWHCRRDGTAFPMLMTGTVVRDASGAPQCLAATAVDLTTSRALESQLRQAQKMESVGRLAGGVAHDFNNMLAVILGHTELAMGQVDADNLIQGDLEEIRKAAERSASLTRQLLAFARKQPIAPRVLDLNETVEGMLKMLRRLIGEDIDLVWEPESGVWPVRVDPSQIDQILANLCVNARDAIAGVGKVTIETGMATLDNAYCAIHAGAVPGDFVRLAVTDDGCGMDEATQGNLFEPFFTTKQTGKGTGLGLATVYGIVKQNHGFINVYSEQGEGTTFTIYLPRHVGTTETVQTPATATPVKRGTETILLVEDEPSMLRLTTTMLERQGYTVLPASTPGGAIRLALEHVGTIHLLMTDVVMPGMNGRDLARNLLSSFPHTRRLFMSGYTADVIAHQGVLDEGVHFIQKPFSTAALADKIRAVLEDSPS